MFIICVCAHFSFELVKDAVGGWLWFWASCWCFWRVFLIYMIAIKELKYDVNRWRVENRCFAVDCPDASVIECYKEIVKHWLIWKKDEKCPHPFQCFQIKMNSFSNMSSLNTGANCFECWTRFFFCNQMNVLFFLWSLCCIFYHNVD